jgi:hypothetical protein
MTDAELEVLISAFVPSIKYSMEQRSAVPSVLRPLLSEPFVIRGLIEAVLLKISE